MTRHWRRLAGTILVFLILYVGSYTGFRATHVEVWDVDGHEYLIIPVSARLLYYLYRPIMYLDASITGMRFHIGPHQERELLGATSDQLGLSRGPTPPQGWRYPSPEELSDYWGYRERSPVKYASAEADLNADGVADQAFLLKNTAARGEGLLVWLSCGKGCFDWMVLDTVDWGPEYSGVALSMGIDILPPGTYDYRCVDDGDCITPDTDGLGRPRITIEIPALSYFQFEGAASFFHWDAPSKAFVRVWTSD